MSIIFTRDRAERLATYMERSGFRVKRGYWIPATRRTVGGMTINVQVYATVWRRSHLVMVINHEWIDRDSVLV